MSTTLKAVLMFVYLVPVIAVIGALWGSRIVGGSWQRLSDGRMLEFRSPWITTLIGTIQAIIYIGGVLFTIFIYSSYVNPPGPLWQLVLFIFAAGWGFMLWLFSPQKLAIDLQDKTYRYSRSWFKLWCKPCPRPLAEFSGVWAKPGGMLTLEFRKKQGLVYGIVLGSFANSSQAQEKAKEFSNLTGLPIVTYPGNKRDQGFSA